MGHLYHGYVSHNQGATYFNNALTHTVTFPNEHCWLVFKLKMNHGFNR